MEEESHAKFKFNPNRNKCLKSQENVSSEVLEKKNIMF
jgi:hypothetical protein